MLVVALSRVISREVATVRFGEERLDHDAMAALPTGRDELEAWVAEFV